MVALAAGLATEDLRVERDLKVITGALQSRVEMIQEQVAAVRVPPGEVPLGLVVMDSQIPSPVRLSHAQGAEAALQMLDLCRPVDPAEAARGLGLG